MGLINKLDANIPDPGSGGDSGRYLSAQEKADLVQQALPFNVKDVYESKSSFKDERTGELRKQWNFVCVLASGGDEFKLSFSRTRYRDALVSGLLEALGEDGAKETGVGPFKLITDPTKSGKGYYQLADWETPKTPMQKVESKAGTVKCPSCKQMASGAIQEIDGDKFVAHKCPKDGKVVMLEVK